jgi:hypothetical protein
VKQFIARHAALLLGVLSGFDRLRLRGTLRFLATERGLMNFLWKVQIKLKEFKAYSQDITNRLRGHVTSLAKEAGRPVVYLNSPAISKEDYARDLAQRDKIEEGLICVLTSVEPCHSYEIRSNGETQQLELRRSLLKCLHQYLYFIDPVFGFGHLRLQTWFPFTIHVCVNGREWLCRELQRRGIGFVRRDNCVVAVEDVAAAQEILRSQVTADWQGMLNRLAHWAFPLHQTLLNGDPLNYYWSADDSEWASDLMFRSPRQLARLYPHLVQHAFQTCSSTDVMRFLGRKAPPQFPPGTVPARFAGQVLTQLRKRPEGVCIKHRLNHNSIKMYDKQGSVLRIETTISDARDIKVFRKVENQPNSVKTWRSLRKGVCDLPRRCQISQSANNRYLANLSAAEATIPLEQLTAKVCRRTLWQGRSVRALRPLEAEDRSLLQVVMRGEFAIHGFRNEDLRTWLFSPPTDAAERRRQSAKVTRQLRLLRAHGLIQKIPKTHRYSLTQQGRLTINALLAALRTEAHKLSKLAA